MGHRSNALLISSHLIIARQKNDKENIKASIDISWIPWLFFIAQSINAYLIMDGAIMEETK